MNLIPKRQKKILLASSKVRLKTFVRHFERVHLFIKIYDYGSVYRILSNYLDLCG